MAVSRNGNIIYIDSGSTGSISGRFQVVGAIFTASGGAANIVVQDNADKKIPWRIDAANKSEYLDMNDTPIRFETSINIASNTNMEAILIVRNLGG